MTERKPTSISFPDWVEHQIRTAQADGAFDNLPGAGKPIVGLDRPQPEMAWIAEHLRRENVEVAGLLPPALALVKEVEVLPDRLLAERSEARVREVVDDLNARIRQAHRRPQAGPPMRVRVVSVDDALAQWRTSMAARVAAGPVAPIHRPMPPVPARRRSWFGRRRSAHG